jgi:hypothetical protein
MLGYFEKLQELKDQFIYINFPNNNNLDDFTDIRELDSKTLLHPLYKEEGFNEIKLDQLIAQIPVTEISDDIELMYNYLRDNI